MGTKLSAFNTSKIVVFCLLNGGSFILSINEDFCTMIWNFQGC